MTGKLNVNGVDHWFSAWWKDSRSGSQFLSLSLGKPVEAQQQSRQEQPRRGNRPAPSRTAPPSRGRNDDFDDTPF
jgi:hypothetical protein